MRIQVLSDIHAEFHADRGTQFIDEYLQPAGVDVLAIAGDMGVGSSLEWSLRRICKRYAKSVVLYVPGNHDFYRNSIDRVLTTLEQLDDSVDNFYLMNNRFLMVNDIPFVGSTLWFPKKKNYKHYSIQLSDFMLIEDFTPRVFDECRESMQFLNWHVSSKAVVITHHLPTHKSVSDKYQGDKLNMFFVCDMEKFIKKRKPRMWIHGHTHDSFNYLLGDTHVVCNPLGYVGRQLNEEFLANMMIDI